MAETEYSYPSADEIFFRLEAGELEIVYARDEGKGYTYITMKDINDGDPERTSDPARAQSSDPRELQSE